MRRRPTARRASGQAQDRADIRSPNDYPMQNPWLPIANKAMRQMHSFLAEFGMTPSARARVAAGELPAAPDPFDDLLNSA
jgi:P27 family predicted phage terminase small subunit